MAVTIRNNADTPNMANNRLVYTISSTKSSEPQFRMVLDILDNNGDLLQRLKQQPNKSNAGVFDIGQIVTNYLGPTDRIWDTATDNTPALNAKCADQFQIRFGEEYASSTTGIPAIYTGLTPESAGEPQVSSSNYNYFINGFWNPNQTGFDWVYQTKYREEETYGLPTFNHQLGLTQYTTNDVRLGDYHTVSILNGNLRGEANADIDNSFAQDVYAMRVEQFDADNGTVALDTLYNLTLRGAPIELWDDVYQNQSYRSRLIHWGVGPQNLIDGGIAIDADCAYYVVTFHNQTAEPSVNDAGIWSTHRFDLVDPECDFPGVRFAWKNQYGVWDYFNFELAESRTSNIQRESYEQNFVDYGTTYAATWDVERRGVSQFQNRIEKNRTAESGYLTQSEADNLRELFFSTDVYIQNPNGTVANNNTFLPVVITNASITEKTNPRSQKLFRFTAEYKYANDQQPRV